MSDHRKPGFRNDALKAALGKWKDDSTKPATPTPPKPAAPRVAPPPRPTRAQRSSGDDEHLFLLAMEDVAPIRSREHEQAGPATPPSTRAREDAEALAGLSELVAGPPISFERRGAMLVGLATGADASLLDHLDAGHFDLLAGDDLRHVPARGIADAIGRALGAARRAGARGVRLTIGDSADGRFETSIRGAFALPALARITLAVAAVPSGALLVLLRR